MWQVFLPHPIHSSNDKNNTDDHSPPIIPEQESSSQLIFLKILYHYIAPVTEKQWTDTDRFLTFNLCIWLNLLLLIVCVFNSLIGGRRMTWVF